MRKNLPEIPKPQISDKTKGLIAVTAVNSIILTVFYFFATSLNTVIIPAEVISKRPIFLGEIVYIAYWTVFAVFFLIFFAYNRAFTRKGITVEMLPDTIPIEEKVEIVQDVKRRSERSKWMLAVIIPLLVTIGIDAIYLFTWPMVQNLFNIS